MSAGASPLGLFERYLSIWVLLAILAGLGLGIAAPGAVGVLAGLSLVAFANRTRARFPGEPA